jgi:hypothetical protein
MLSAVVVPVTDARSRAGAVTAAVVAHSLPQRFQHLKLRGFLARMQAHAFGSAVIDGDEHRHLAFFDRGRQGVVAGPDFVGRAVMIVPVWGFSALESVRAGATNCASRISRSTRAFDVRTSAKRSRAHTLRWPSP